MSATALEQRARRRLGEWDAAGLSRTLRPPSGVDLSSNDYLNLSRHPWIVGRMLEGVVREGCGSTGSRLLRGERECFDSVETQFARFKGTERALLFGAGYLANIGVVTALAERGDVICSDERNHASLIDAARLSRAETIVFPHNDVDALVRALAGTAAAGVRFVLVESLFSMDGDFAPLRDYLSVCDSAGAILIVDEAHAVGVYGHRGSGLIEEAGIDASRCLSINSGGKALGVGGAFVAGAAWAIEYLIQRARPFVFSTAPPPAIADALDASLSLVQEEAERRLRVRARAEYLREHLAAAGIMALPGTSQIVPVVVGENTLATSVAASLQADGFDVRAIRPPSVPEGTARLRLSVNAGLSTSTLDRVVDRLSAVLKEARACSGACS